MNYLKELNCLAKREIENDLEKAFYLFGLNYKEKLSFDAIHNFGVFLSKYGRESVHYSKKTYVMAESLLKQAISLKPNYTSLKELGDLYFELKRYKLAASQYNQAIKYKRTFQILYNLAVSYFYQGEYLAAQRILQEIFLEFGAIEKDSMEQASMLLAFVYAYIDDKKSAKIQFDKLTQNMKCEITPDILKLAYICKDNTYIVKNYRTLLDNWMYDTITFQIIYHAYLVEGKERADEFVKWFHKFVLKFQQDNPEFEDEEMKKIFSMMILGIDYPEPTFLPQLIYSVEFF